MYEFLCKWNVSELHINHLILSELGWKKDLKHFHFNFLGPSEFLIFLKITCFRYILQLKFRGWAKINLIVINYYQDMLSRKLRSTFKKNVKSFVTSLTKRQGIIFHVQWFKAMSASKKVLKTCKWRSMAIKELQKTVLVDLKSYSSFIIKYCFQQRKTKLLILHIFLHTKTCWIYKTRHIVWEYMYQQYCY